MHPRIEYPGRPIERLLLTGELSDGSVRAGPRLTDAHSDAHANANKGSDPAQKPHQPGETAEQARVLLAGGSLSIVQYHQGT